jgi:hypothetical protein
LVTLPENTQKVMVMLKKEMIGKLLVWVPVSLALGVMLFSVACRNTEHADEIRQLDSLLIVHQETHSLLAQVDTIGAKASREIFAGHWKEITEAIEMIDDPEQVRGGAQWEFITIYSANDRSLRKLLTRHHRLMEASTKNGAQLRQLRADIGRNRIPSDSVDFYLFSESRYIAETHKEAAFYTPELIATHRVLDSLHNHAGEAIARYRAKAAAGATTQ